MKSEIETTTFPREAFFDDSQDLLEWHIDASIRPHLINWSGDHSRCVRLHSLSVDTMAERGFASVTINCLIELLIDQGKLIHTISS